VIVQQSAPQNGQKVPAPWLLGHNPSANERDAMRLLTDTSNGNLVIEMTPGEFERCQHALSDQPSVSSESGLPAVDQVLVRDILSLVLAVYPDNFSITLVNDLQRAGFGDRTYGWLLRQLRAIQSFQAAGVSFNRMKRPNPTWPELAQAYRIGPRGLQRLLDVLLDENRVSAHRVDRSTVSDATRFLQKQREDEMQGHA
jgi:hypothetical protein